MDIYTCKTRLEQSVRPAPSAGLILAEQAWGIFCASVLTGLDEPRCEEFSFSMSPAAWRDGRDIVTDESRFQVYFGRLIDAAQPAAWRTAEINFYYRYAMTPQIRGLLAALDRQDMETAFCSSDAPGAVRGRLETVFAFARQRAALWDAIRGASPLQESFEFGIQ